MTQAELLEAVKTSAQIKSIVNTMRSARTLREEDSSIEPIGYQLGIDNNSDLSILVTHVYLRGIESCLDEAKENHTEKLKAVELISSLSDNKEEQ